MDDLITLVKTYRVTASLEQRVRLAEGIFQHIAPKLRYFVFGSVRDGSAEDVLQEVLKAIATSLRRFEGDTKGEFWAWCYRIARNKRTDHFRRRATDQLIPISQDGLRDIMDESAAISPMSRGENLDLDYAMKLLTAAKPECHELLWAHYVQGFDYGEIAQDGGITYDAARMKITRCLSEVRALVA